MINKTIFSCMILIAILVFLITYIFEIENYVNELERRIVRNEILIKNITKMYGNEVNKHIFLSTKYENDIMAKDNVIKKLNNSYQEQLSIINAKFMNEKQKIYSNISMEYGKISIIERKYKFMEIAKKLSEEKTYNEDNYNCQHYSRDFVQRMWAAGYMSETRTVKTNCDSERFKYTNCDKFNGLHMITIMHIPFEPQTGEPIAVEEYKDYGISG